MQFQTNWNPFSLGPKSFSMLKRAFSLSRQRLSSRKIHCTFRLCKEAETEEDMDKLQSNPYYSKYADKISKLQRWILIEVIYLVWNSIFKIRSSSPQQFLERLSVLEEKSATKSNKKEPDFSMPTKPKSGSGATMQQKEKVKKKFNRLSDEKSLGFTEIRWSDETWTDWRQNVRWNRGNLESAFCHSKRFERGHSTRNLCSDEGTLWKIQHSRQIHFSYSRK